MEVTDKIDEIFDKLKNAPFGSKENSELTKSDILKKKLENVLTFQQKMFSQFLLLPMNHFSPVEINEITKVYDDFCKALNDCKSYVQTLMLNNEIEKVLSDENLLKTLETDFSENRIMYENISNGIKKSNFNDTGNCISKLHQSYSDFLMFLGEFNL